MCTGVRVCTCVAEADLTTKFSTEELYDECSCAEIEEEVGWEMSKERPKLAFALGGSKHVSNKSKVPPELSCMSFA